jgi:hypothetical protein
MTDNFSIDLNKSNLNYFEAALLLGHTGTSRVQSLVRDGRLQPGTEPKTISRTSVLAYKEDRQREGAGDNTPVWFKVKLTRGQADALKAASPTLHGDGPDWSTLAPLYEYDADERKARELKRKLREAAADAAQ